MTKNLLVLSYYFPPEGGPAVQRISKFIKYLNTFDYQVIVITSRHRIKVIDTSLLQDIKSTKFIYRIIDLGSFIPKKIIKIILRKNYIDQHQLWNYLVELRIKSIFKKDKPEILFSTTPPHSSNMLAYKISIKYNIPWVADFRDEWTYDPNFHKHFNKVQIFEIEKKILSHAAAITTVTQKAQGNFSKIINSKDKVFCIYNGYDEDDYVNITKKNSVNKKLRIIYTGRFTQKSSPEKLFSVLNEMINSKNKMFDDMEIQVVGQAGNKNWIKKYPALKKLVSFIPYLPHEISVKLLAESDVLLLLASNTPESEVFTGKLFEYMFFEKPILAIIRYRGELSEWITNYGNVYIGIESEENSIRSSINKMYEDFCNGNLNKKVNKEFIEKYKRKTLTKLLVDIFNNVINEQKRKQ